jgi:Flp pilus assembly protein TadG
MRVNRAPMRSTIDRLRREESGAALMVVAVCLIVLMGMLVLVVDLGRAVAIKRQMVNGSDGAVLAAAQQCALGNSLDDAEDAADAVLAENRGDATMAGFDAPGCGAPPDGPELVTVESTVDVDYFFAGIFGFESGPVVSRAVAVWGVTEEGHAVPITVDLQQLNDCGIDPDSPPDSATDCEIDYPKDALTEPRWGTLDLEHWGDPDAAPCSTSAGELKDQIENGGVSEPLPAPAHTCMDNGLSDSVWEAMVGKTLLFPVMDLTQSTGLVKPNNPPLGNTPCSGADIEDLRDAGYDCQIDTAYIVGWIELFVVAVHKHGSDLSVEYEYEGFTTTPGLPCDADPCPLGFGAHAVRLVE